jgi:hypothetical protein
MLALQCLSAIHGATAQNTKWTGWSNGKGPTGTAPNSHVTVTLVKCKVGSYIEIWRVGRGNVVNWSSIVSIQAFCSDGALLTAIKGRNSATDVDDITLQDIAVLPGAVTSFGFECSQLRGCNNQWDAGWMTDFFQVRQTAMATCKPLQLSCGSIPPDYVAVGYEGFTGDAVDAVNFLMAPRSTATTLSPPTHHPLLHSHLHPLPRLQPYSSCPPQAVWYPVSTEQVLSYPPSTGQVLEAYHLSGSLPLPHLLLQYPKTASSWA